MLGRQQITLSLVGANNCLNVSFWLRWGSYICWWTHNWSFYVLFYLFVSLPVVSVPWTRRTFLDIHKARQIKVQIGPPSPPRSPLWASTVSQAFSHWTDLKVLLFQLSYQSLWYHQTGVAAAQYVAVVTVAKPMLFYLCVCVFFFVFFPSMRDSWLNFTLFLWTVCSS